MIDYCSSTSEHKTLHFYTTVKAYEVVGICICIGSGEVPTGRESLSGELSHVAPERSHSTEPSACPQTDVEVFRKDSKKLPIGDPEIDWEETVYLNLIVHQFDYTLTLAICTRTSPKELQVLKRHSQKVSVRRAAAAAAAAAHPAVTS